jgi:drug/metabolite transporter (DMT)-like permease
MVRAIGLMVLGMALLAASDAFIKAATRIIPMGQTMFVLSFGGSLFFIFLALMKRIRITGPEFWARPVMMRNGFEIIGALGLVVSLATIPLATFAAIMQAAPLVTTLGAALFLREKVGWRRWSAIMVGFAGMLLVVRPFGASYTGWEMFAVLGVVGLAARDLTTRLAPQSVHSLTLSVWGFASTIPLGLVLLQVSGQSMIWDNTAAIYMIGAILVTTTGYLAVTSAMRLAPVSIVAPFRYSRLIFTTGLGILIFGERPDLQTYLGAALVLTAGIYSFWREAQAARAHVA